MIEVVIAVGILIAVSIGAAMVLTLTLNSLARSRQRAIALVLARSRLETLISGDTDATSGLSPPDALTVSRAGFVDYLDEQGQSVAAAGAVYVRRWSVARSGAGTATLVIVQVMVRTRGGDRDAVWISGARMTRGEGGGT